jgi:uncharacterized membrane protein YgcG
VKRSMNPKSSTASTNQSTRQMTDPTNRDQRLKTAARPSRKRIQPAPVIAVGAASFTLALGLLGWQVAIGKDPSLGHGKQKPKIVHRQINRTIITKVYDKPKVIYVPADPAPSGGGYSSGSSVGSGYSAYSGGSSSSSGSSSSGGSPSYSAPSAPAPSYSPPPVSSGAS